MVSEQALLASLLHSRDAWLAVYEHVEPDSLSAHGAALLEEIADYYQRDDSATRCDVTLIRDRVSRKLPKHAELFASLLRDMPPELGSANVVREVLELKRRKAGEELILVLNQGKSPAAVQPVLEEYLHLNSATDLYDTGGGVTMLTTSVADLFRASSKEENLIKLLPRRLNAAMRGGVLPGHCVVIIGRVNVGKSALAVNNIAGFLMQGKKVLLIENEDLAEDVKRRIAIRLAQCTLTYAEEYPDKVMAVAKARGIDNLMMPDPAPGSVKELDRLAAMLTPDVIVVNQLRHLAASKEAATDGVGAIDRVAQGLRAMGKRRRILMVLVGAAKEGEVGYDGLAKEKVVLEMSDSYGSRTGVPGIADIMLAIGDSAPLRERGMVAVHLCKNKRGGSMPVLYQKVNLENCVFRDP